MESTPAPATPRRMLAPAPLKRDLTPSLATIWLAASKEDLYLTACDLISRILRLGQFPGRCTHLTRSHHHTSADSVEWVRSDTSTSGDSPAEEERGQEVTLEGTGEEDRLERIVHSEVETTVDNDTSDGRTETTVETRDTISGDGLLVDIEQTVELTVTTSLGVLGVVGETSTGVVEGVDEEEGSGTGHLYDLLDSCFEAF